MPFQPVFSSIQLCTRSRAASRAPAACRGEIGEPAEAVPCGEPFRPGRRRRPARRRIADELAGELDLTGGNRRAALGVTRPALRDSEPEVGGNPPDQRMPIERAGGERLQRVAAQPSQQPGRIGADGGVRQSAALDRFRLPARQSAVILAASRAVARPAAGRVDGRLTKGCAGRGNPMRFVTRKDRLPQAGEPQADRAGPRAAACPG